MSKSCDICLRGPKSEMHGTYCSACGDDYLYFVPPSDFTDSKNEVEFDEDRMDVVGSNGNDGLHYDRFASILDKCQKMAAKATEIPCEYKAKWTRDVVITDGFKAIVSDNTATGFLRRAEQIMTERGKTYDKPEGERSMGKTVQAFNAITGKDLSESDGWLFMDCLKKVRQWQRKDFHQDSADDAVAYAALTAEALARGV